MHADVQGPRPAAPADLDAVVGLIRRCGLPVEGVAAMLEAGTLFVITGHAGDVIGTVGLERHGEQVLLRSLAVESRWRGRRVGSALVDAAVDAAGPAEVWLLTETAEAFLAGCGFHTVDRAKVVGPVTESFEWRHACPASATAMTWGR